MMQGDVGIAAAQPCQKRRHKARESNQGIASKCAEEQIEPHHVRFQLLQCLQQTDWTCEVIERPAAEHGETLQFRLNGGDFVRQNRKAKKGVAPELLSNVKTVLAQPSLTGRKSGYQA
jgi:hypothetical protein